MLFSWNGPTAQKTHENVYLGGSLVATIDHDWPSNAVIATKYQHTDALGSPVAVTNTAGVVIERTNYEPYGAAINKTVNGIGYTGHVMDGATGLTYMQQRYYDPGVGRFLSVDPVTAYGGDMRHFNRYTYAYNNPYKFTDPDGRAPPGCGDGTCRSADERAMIDDGPITPLYPEAALPMLRLPRLISQIRDVVQRVPDRRPDGVPKNWEKSPSDKGGGEKYRNPENPKSNDEVRTMPGNPNSPNPAQQKPYNTRQVDGKSFDAKGNEVPRGSAESHIKPEEFKFIPREQLIPKK